MCYITENDANDEKWYKPFGSLVIAIVAIVAVIVVFGIIIGLLVLACKKFDLIDWLICGWICC